MKLSKKEKSLFKQLVLEECANPWINDVWEPSGVEQLFALAERFDISMEKIAKTRDNFTVLDADD